MQDTASSEEEVLEEFVREIPDLFSSTSVLDIQQQQLHRKRLRSQLSSKDYRERQKIEEWQLRKKHRKLSSENFHLQKRVTLLKTELEFLQATANFGERKDELSLNTKLKNCVKHKRFAVCKVKQVLALIAEMESRCKQKNE